MGIYIHFKDIVISETSYFYPEKKKKRSSKILNTNLKLS